MRWIKGDTTQEYSATDEDALDLARAIAREGAPHRAVAWALVQRFALLYPRYPTLSAFVRAYSQPINPRWFTDGDLHAKRMKQLEGDEAAQADELARARRREGYAVVPWDKLPASARALALEAIEATGESPVPGAVHFRASMAPARATKRQAFERAKRYADSRADLVDVVRIPEGYGPGVNWFFTSASSPRVRMLADGEDAMLPDLVPPPRAQAAPAPKAPGAPPSEPPEGVQAGEGWGWVWCWLPSLSGRSADVDQGGDEAPPASSSSPADDELMGAPLELEGHPAEAAADALLGDALPPGPVMTLAQARAAGMEIIGDDEGEPEPEPEPEPKSRRARPNGRGRARARAEG